MAWPKEEPYDRYPSDLTDEEWEVIKPILEQTDPYTTGRPRKVDLREVVNALFYLKPAASGGICRNAFPRIPWSATTIISG